MPDQKEGIVLSIITPQGPICMGFSIEGFTNFVKMLNTILDMNTKKKTPIPKVFEDAFQKEE